MDADFEQPTRPGTKIRPLGWQHWDLTLPRAWDPIRIVGDAAAGRIELADTRGPTFGLRWSTPGRRFDPEQSTQDALREEVGALAADEATPGIAPEGDWTAPLLYEEPNPPGRDVWSAFSPTTGRLVQLIYFANRRDSVLRDRLLPTLIDHKLDEATPWAVYDLQVTAPADARLAGHRLNAGDLSLRFAGPPGPWIVRKLAPARLALDRRPLPDWAAEPPPPIGEGDRAIGRHYRVIEKTSPTPTTATALSQRRRRFVLLRLPRQRHSLALHDVPNDRLWLLNGSDAPLLNEIATTLA